MPRTLPDELYREAEAFALARFAEAGFLILAPATNEGVAYSFAVDDGKNIGRIGIKVAHLEDGYLRFATPKTGRSLDRFTADYFAAFLPTEKQLYIVPAMTAASGEQRLRLGRPGNNQNKGVKWAQDHLFDGQLPFVYDWADKPR